jgi:hypothetical protein
MIESRSIYGSGTPTVYELDLYYKPRRAYGLRSSNSLDGYYPAQGERARARKPKQSREIDPEREQARLRLEQAKLMRQLERDAERERAEKTRAYLESVRHVEQYN